MIGKSNTFKMPDDFGYQRSSETSGNSVDYGDWTSVSPAASSGVFAGMLSQQFAKQDASAGQRGMVSSMMDTRTSMQKLHPDRGFNAVKFNLSDNTRNVCQVVNDGNKVATRTANACVENEQTRGALKQQHTQDVAQATESLKATAEDNGVSSGAVLDSALPGASADKATAAGVIAADVCLGGALSGMGSFVTIATPGASVFAGLSKDQKNLDADKQKSIIADDLQKLQNQSSPAQLDTRMSASAGGGGSVGVGDNVNHAHWENFNVDDYEDFLATRFENLEEVKALDESDSLIDQARANQQFVAENYGSTGDLVAKADAAGGRSHAIEAELQGATVAVDLGQVELSMYSMSEMTVTLPDQGYAANDASSFNNVVDIKGSMGATRISEVETTYDPSKMNQGLLAGEVSTIMGNDMNSAYS